MASPESSIPVARDAGTARDRKKPGGWVGTALALVGLHAVLSIRFPWESSSFLDALLSLSPDLVLVLALACAISMWLGTRRFASHALVVVVFGLLLYRLGDTAVPVFFEREFDPYNDVLLVPALDHLLLHGLPSWQQWAALGLFLAGVVLAYVVVLRLCSRIVADLSAVPRVYGLLIVCQLLVVAGWVQKSAGAGPRLWAQGVATHVVDRVVRTVREQPWWIGERFAERVAAAKTELARVPEDLGRLAGADVYLIFIESYGAALFRGDRRGEVERWMRDRQGDLSEAGFAACSGFVTPSTRGTGSGYAHAQLVSGVKVENVRALWELLETDLVPLPKLLSKIGYRTVNVQPAMTELWTRGREFFGFDRHLFQTQLGYSGHPYPWGRMPDQFALGQILETEVEKAEQPLFVQYVAVSSHSPFAEIPRYADDWSLVADPAVFRSEPAVTYDLDWQNYVGHPQAAEAYARSIHYSVQAAIGFTCRLPRPSLVVMLGDHQPPPVGEMTKTDTSYDVPIHAISNRAELLAPFRGWGFTDGLVPAADCKPFDSARFLTRFLRDFSGGGK